MAGTHPFLTKLRAILATQDDDALAALTNKGLLRRAQKDLETQRPTLAEVTDTHVRLTTTEATVVIPELLVKSTCTCPASGICRHVLLALVALRDALFVGGPQSADPQPAEPAEPPVDSSATDVTPVVQRENRPASATVDRAAAVASPAEVLGSVSDEELQKWAGKATYRKGVTLLANSPNRQVEVGGTLVVKFPDRNLVCRWIPSSGLVGMVCSCQAENACEHVVAAVLAYQITLGRETVTPVDRVLTESSGAPRTRAEVLESVGNVLREILVVGCSRMAPASSQRLTTLAVSAHGVDLPRLERQIRGLAKEVDLMLRRDAQASVVNLLAHAARLEALRSTLVHSNRPDHVGEHRSQYHSVGEIPLVGLGAQRWVSKGGYKGVTVYFWDESRKNWATWTDARPVRDGMFDPLKRFREDGPWTGCGTPDQASQNQLRLLNAFRNANGRLSGRPATKALVVAPTDLSTLPNVLTGWNEIRAQAASQFGGGLTNRPENQELVLLRPSDWGPPFFDTLRQELLRPIVDATGQQLNLWLPFSEENRAAIDWLERLQSKERPLVLGAIRLVVGQVAIQPISLLEPKRIVSLNLLRDLSGKTNGKSNAVKSAPRRAGTVGNDPGSGGEEAEVELDGDPVELTGPATPLGRLLITALAELETLAENGVVARRDPKVLEEAARRMDALGLSVCARPISRLAAELRAVAPQGNAERPAQIAGTLLRVAYVLRLTADAELASNATAMNGT